ncbi:MAG: phosphoenolpyruvate synthase PpsA [Desulfobacterales bacterium]|nr:phosphoenolpyruvate synthase PpsA [Desulfobacterales bacterium]
MAHKVNEIMLVSSPYDAFIMEEDGRLAERIIHEYRGLNLSSPPMLTWVSNSKEALDALSKKNYDLVISMPRMDDIEPLEFGRKIKEKYPELPFFLLVHNTSRLLLDSKYTNRNVIDKVYVWFGNTDLLLALIKNVEDRMNIQFDTERAWVRVIIMVEDSPRYLSSILPLLYRQIVTQTQAVIEDSINAEHRMLRMRARPKILVAENYEEAEKFYNRFKPYILSIFSDVRFPRKGQLDNQAGLSFLKTIHEKDPHIPLLLLSSEESNRALAERVPAVFLNKNSTSLHKDIGDFFIQYLGFGDFIFRNPDGSEIGKASNLRSMEEVLPKIPVESVYYHATRNHFSSWLMARSEIKLASKLRPIKATDFKSPQDIKDFLIQCVHERRKGRQRGVITDFGTDFDPDTDFSKTGKGSLGGKARGLAFISTLLKRTPEIQEKFPEITVRVPRVLVITTEAFDDLIRENQLKHLATDDFSDEQVIKEFMAARLPDWLLKNLKKFIVKAGYPLAVRSSSLLEDAQHEPFAGIYRTYMLPNKAPEVTLRYERILNAIKLVFASIYLKAPKAYAKTTMHRLEEEKMAVILQELTGMQYGDYFYPAISGVAQSHNFYPIGHLKPEDGLVHLAMGLGKTVVEGEKALRFCPRYPQFLPQFSTVEDILENAQRHLYALKFDNFPENLYLENGTLAKLSVDEIKDCPALAMLSSTYIPEENRIRDTTSVSGHRIITFFNILKYGVIPLPEILFNILQMGSKGMGSPVEIEFALNLPADKNHKPELSLLQIRPMAHCRQLTDIEITENEIRNAFCYSSMALGLNKCQGIRDIVFVKPENFDPAGTMEIADEIGQINGKLLNDKRKYLLIGPGRWGSADRWLGIPVRWNDIAGVGAMVEASTEKLKADPSQGSHFFHNITALGISYLTVSDNDTDFLDWDWLRSLPEEKETRYLKHVKLDKILNIKIDGKKSHAVILK